MLLTKRDLKKLVLTEIAKKYDTDKYIWRVGTDKPF